MKFSIVAALGCLSLASAQAPPGQYQLRVSTGPLADPKVQFFQGKVGDCLGLEKSEWANGFSATGEINSCTLYAEPKCEGDQGFTTTAKDRRGWKKGYKNQMTFGGSGQFASIRCSSEVWAAEESDDIDIDDIDDDEDDDDGDDDE